LLTSPELRKTPVVIGQLLWRPFDARFESFQKQLAFHCEALHTEKELISISASVAAAERSEMEQNIVRDFQKKIEDYARLHDELGQAFNGQNSGQ
jgi:hypothetical protein